MNISSTASLQFKKGHQGDKCSLELADLLRLSADDQLDRARQVELGQFFTKATVARFMASLFQVSSPSIHLLDAGAGVGSLSAAFVSDICRRKNKPQSLEITAYETDRELIPYLQETLQVCREQCKSQNIKFKSNVANTDFISASVEQLNAGLFFDATLFDCVILNPPYRKLRSNSDWRNALSSVGIETSNLYTAFLWLSMHLLKPGGEMVAITPRSFCNGPYFKPFRIAFNEAMDFRRFHIIESRLEAFQDNKVLQENIIFHVAKKIANSTPETAVTISSSADSEDSSPIVRVVSRTQVIRPTDPDVVINLVADELGQRIVEQILALPASLLELGINVSTGRVVDFRAKEYLRTKSQEGSDEITAPLIYPLHFAGNFIDWPIVGAKKPNALTVTHETQSLLNNAGIYVLVKRFTSKEQSRRIVAAIYDPERIKPHNKVSSYVGFENHLNYFHENGSELPRDLATGLAAFLNSTVVDEFFRQFNGHTQVNATDLRNLRYPLRTVLEALGRRIINVYGDSFPNQNQLDTLFSEEIFPMPDATALNPVQAKNRIDEALAIIKALKLNRQQQNERSALTLLALLNLTPSKNWGEAANPLCGIPPMMEFFREYYGKTYAPNTRETVRRQTVHQFMQAGLLVANPDDPTRPINSAKNVYQITPEALELMRVFGTEEWEKNLAAFLASQAAIRARALRNRAMHRIPVIMPSGDSLTLSPGGQNLLIKEILEQFCPRYTGGGKVLYLGDADEKWNFYDSDYLESLGVVVNEHGKMPDVVIHHIEKNWLVLVEAVTSHGPVDFKRHIELKELFANSTAGLVFVTAFLDRAAMSKYLRDIAWETEVWVSDAPDHLIHFNGERFLGPYRS